MEEVWDLFGELGLRWLKLNSKDRSFTLDLDFFLRAVDGTQLPTSGLCSEEEGRLVLSRSCRRT